MPIQEELDDFCCLFHSGIVCATVTLEFNLNQFYLIVFTIYLINFYIASNMHLYDHV